MTEGGKVKGLGGVKMDQGLAYVVSDRVGSDLSGSFSWITWGRYNRNDKKNSTSHQEIFYRLRVRYSVQDFGYFWTDRSAVRISEDLAESHAIEGSGEVEESGGTVSGHLAHRVRSAVWGVGGHCRAWKKCDEYVCTWAQRP